MKILEIKNLSSGYKEKNKTKIISSNINLEISKGELIALIGPNGSGKSTLLRTISGLQDKIKGQINIQNKNIFKITTKERAFLLSLVLTEDIYAQNMSVYDLVSIGRHPYSGHLGILTDTDKKKIIYSLQKLNLHEYTNRFIDTLSDGEKQRVMIARALAQDTPLMMLDEPTAHLDLPNRVELMKSLLELTHSTQKAIIISTHELDLAIQWCDKIWLMDKKGDISVGTPEDLILENNISKTFSSKSFNFDIESGNFIINRNTNHTILIYNKTFCSLWLKKALERIGYKAELKNTPFNKKQDKNINYILYIYELDYNKWKINYNNKKIICTNIEEVLHNIPNPKSKVLLNEIKD